MILVWLIAIPFAGGLLALVGAQIRETLARWIALAAVTAALGLAVVSFVMPGAAAPESPRWIAEMDHSWIPQLGVSFHLGMDGLSLVLAFLTLFLGITAVAASWSEIREKTGFFYLNLLWVLSGILGVFVALDLFVFYFFWEMMLIPMYFLIALWGHENRHYASVKFFLYTQLSGLLMLLSIAGLAFVHARATGQYTFDYSRILGTEMSLPLQFLLMSGFVVAFGVKLPVLPFHTWLPDAHTEAPAAGSVILAGLLLKTGAYGFLRFVFPLFPEAAAESAPFAMGLAVAGILYGGVLAFAQTDLKRLVAYTSVSHMGFVLLGIYAANGLAMQGAVLQMVCHGIATGALFILVGALQERIHTRELSRMGGLWSTAPRLAGTALFFALASLGLPGLGNFVAEFLVLIGTFRVNVPLTVIAAFGIVIATVYSLWIVQKAFHGPNVREWNIPDLGAREMAVMTAMIAALLWLGLYPQPVISAASHTLAPAETRATENAVLNALLKENQPSKGDTDGPR